ncbi:MAG: hypothetical protein ACSLEX_01875 [Minisyncoccota bacterium]
MTLPNKKQSLSYGILLVLFLAMFGLAWYVIMPLHATLMKKARAMQEFYAERENQERQIAKLPQLQEQYEYILQNEKQLGILITESDVVPFIRTVEELARSMNVRLNITSKDNGKLVTVKKAIPQTPAQDLTSGDELASDTPSDLAPVPRSKNTGILDALPFDQYINLEMRVEGEYRNVTSFLKQLETLPIALDVVKITINKKSHEEERLRTPTRVTSNPFGVLGDGVSKPIATSEVVQTSDTSVVEPNRLEALFDVVVYIKH